MEIRVPSPAELRAAAEEAVRREMAGDFEPFVMATPYVVEFTLRPSYPPEVEAAVDTITNYPLEKLGERSYRMVTDDADQIGYLLDAIEEIVLPCFTAGADDSEGR